MKTFVYTCRDNLGALKKGSLQAVDRVDALHQIKAKGYVPISVAEGKAIVSAPVFWNPAWNKLMGLVAAGILLLTALTVWQISNRKSVAKSPVPATAVAKKSTSKPATPAVKASQPIHQPAATTPMVDTSIQAAPAKAPTGKASENRSAVDRKPAKEESKEEPPLHPSSYNTQTEGLLAMAMSVPPGEAIPPMPISPNLDADFANSLTNEIVIFTDDDERTANIKENVAVAKNQLLEMVKQGRSVSEVLQEYQQKANEQADIRSEALKELTDLYQSGKTDEAQAYLEKVNKELHDLGITPISLPRPRIIK